MSPKDLQIQVLQKGSLTISCPLEAQPALIRQLKELQITAEAVQINGQTPGLVLQPGSSEVTPLEEPVPGMLRQVNSTDAILKIQLSSHMLIEELNKNPIIFDTILGLVKKHFPKAKKLTTGALADPKFNTYFVMWYTIANPDRETIVTGRANFSAESVIKDFADDGFNILVNWFRATAPNETALIPGYRLKA